MYNRRYDKVFLMLRQETAGYGVGQRAPWGSCVMEIKNGTGRVSLTIQGLRPIHRGRYAVYAMAGEKEKQTDFFCGVLVPDTAGHAELKWDFNPDQLEGKAMTAEELNVVAILAEADGGFSAPLTAYFGSRVEWRAYFKGVSNKREPIKEPIKELKKEPKKEPKKELHRMKEVFQETPLVAAEAMSVNAPAFELPKIHWKSDAPKDEVVKPKIEDARPKVEDAKPKEARKESSQGNFRGLLEKFRMELEELQDAGVFTDKEMERIQRAGRRTPQNEVVSAAVNSTAPVVEAAPDVAESPAMELPKVAEVVEENKHELTQAFLGKYKLLKENMDIFPFAEETEPWKCISVEEMVLLDQIPLIWMKDYFILNAMKKYHHLIWKPQAAGYCIGVPAMDTGADSTKAQELGFSEFKKMEDGALGYWIFTKK